MQVVVAVVWLVKVPRVSLPVVDEPAPLQPLRTGVPVEEEAILPFTSKVAAGAVVPIPRLPLMIKPFVGAALTPA